MTTPEPLSDEEIGEIRDQAGYMDATVAEDTLRLLDEHARLKAEERELDLMRQDRDELLAIVERFRALRAKESLNTGSMYSIGLVGMLDAALSPDASTTEAKR